MVLSKNAKPDFKTILFYCLMSLILLYNIVKVIRFKEVDVHNYKLELKYLFRFKAIELPFEEIKTVKGVILKGEGGSGPGFIEFPIYQLSIESKKGKIYTFSARENNKLQDIESELKRRIAKINPSAIQ